jgi:hypothetical protein
VLMRRSALKHREGRLAVFPWHVAVKLLDKGLAEVPTAIGD